MENGNHHVSSRNHQELALAQHGNHSESQLTNGIAPQKSRLVGEDRHPETQITNGEAESTLQLSHSVNGQTSVASDSQDQRDVSSIINGDYQETTAGTVKNDQQPSDVVRNGHQEITAPKDENHQLPAHVSGHIEQDLTLSEIKGEDFPQVVPTLWETFIDSATRYPTNLAIASVHQKGELYGLPNLVLDHEAYGAQPYLRWSYSNFANALVRTIQGLKAEQITEGSSIFTVCNNSVEFVLILWAGLALGCNVIPIHPRVLMNKDELIHVVRTANSASSSDRTIVFTQTATLAKQLLDFNIVSAHSVVVLEGDDSHSQWRSFAAFLPRTTLQTPPDLTQYRKSTTRWALIIFTSGTTALPKGVVLDSFRIDRIIAIRRHAAPVSPGDSCFLPLPTNHAFFHLFGLLAPGSGAGIVLPSPTFKPQNAPEIMELERCAFFPMSPAMVHAIVEVVKSRGIKFSSLKNISTGGAKLSIELLRGCLDVIGSQGIEILYGSTEGCVTVGTGIFTSVDAVVRNGDASVGVPAMGCTIKICGPDDNKPLPRNTEGNLHYSSVTRSDGYAGGDKPDTFYTDEQGRPWFATGDAAVINDEGLVFVVGRIKDMIIRGGVNIAPAAIEFVLGKDPETEHFQIQIVGKLDPIATEVPIGVSIKPVTQNDVDKIQSTILSQMGTIYEPEEILTLEQLGLQDFPRTLLGKVQKGKLTALVRKYLDDRESPKATQPEIDELTDKVQKVWTRTIGHSVKTDTEITSFADSITIMRVRDRFKKDLGADISLAEMLDIRTVGDQVKLVKERAKSQTTKKTTIRTNTGGPTIKDMVHLALTPQWFQSTQAWISDKIKKHGFEWNDIQEITPASDFTSVATQADIQNTGWSFKFALLAKEGVNKETLRNGIEVLLANHPMLASFLFASKQAFGSDISLHVMPKPTPKLFDKIFHDYGRIATKEQFSNEVYKPYEYQMSMVPGLLINFLMYDVEDCGRSGAVMVTSHASVDATYVQLLFDDLDKAIGGASELDPNISYKTWADSYYSLRTSYEAQVQVAWHVRRLDDLTAHKPSVFPAPFDPHDSTVRTHFQGVSDNGYHTDFHIPGMTNLRGKHSQLSAPPVIKAAWSLVNIHRNGTETAIFSNLQADRRRFPFVPKALELLSPAHTFEAGRVAGPTYQDVISIIPLYPEETVLEFMHRVAADQEELNENAAAPLKTILKEVGPINAEIMIDIFRSQIFNWTPGLGALQTHNPNENYELLASFIRPKLRLVINVDVGGADDETCYAQIKSPLYDMDGHKSMADDLQDFVIWLCDEKNWGQRMGDFKSALRSEEERRAANGNVKKKHHIL